MRTLLPVFMALLFPCLGGVTAADKTRTPRAGDRGVKRGAPPPRTPAKSGKLNAEELARLEEILARRAGRDGAPIRNNVLIRINRYEVVAHTRSIRSLLLALDARKTRDGRAAGSRVRGYPRRIARDGLRLKLGSWSPDRKAELELGSMLEKKLGATGHEVSLMSQVGRTSYVAVLTRSTEAWNARYVPPPLGGVPQEPVLIENVVGTGLKIKVRAASRRGIILTVTPYFRTRVQDGPKSRFAKILVEELRTTVHALPGQPVVLGGVSDKHGDAVNSIFSRRARSGTRSSMIVLRVTLHDARRRP